MRRYVSMFALLLFAGVAGAQEPVVRPLLLRPGDLIRLEVPDVADLSGEFTVAEDGSVLLPLIGSLIVTGRPFTDVSGDIVKSYARELIETPVRVTPVLRIAVLGEVRQPGLVPADPTYTLADVLAAAGGLTPDGDAGRITLLRDGESLRFSLDDSGVLLSRRLMPGDQVVVARRSWLGRNMNVLVGAAASVVAAAVTSLILR
ncbi:MAG TPA: SLBB domain-containing protein [Longimicrobiales bacterium]|nr:SLBB domain-containing protein [Longimicrobiales bacterium]